MGQLLREPIFDVFEVRSVDVVTTTRTNFDGGIVTDESEDEQKKQSFISWKALRPLVYEIIKASPKPRTIKIVFSYHAEGLVDIHTNAAALFLNLVYENDTVLFTTGVAQKEFIFEKTLDIAWDEWISAFFANAGLEVSERE